MRQPPLSAEFLAANPDMVVVERYATRQEAEDIVIGGGSDIPEIASEPVWVVRIKGATLVQAIGGSGRVDSEGRGRSAYEEVDEVAYMISERTGQLLAITLSSQPLEKRQPASGE